MKRNLYEEIRDGFEYLKNHRPPAASSSSEVSENKAAKKGKNRKTKKADS